MAILIIGYGKLGKSLSQQLQPYDTTYGLKRHKGNNELIPIVTGDIQIPKTITLPKETDTIFFMPSADEYSVKSYRETYLDGLKNVLTYIKDNQMLLRRFFFISSTAVYHHCHGEWVDERTRTSPKHFSGQILLQAEKLLQSHSNVPSTVIRFSGIYGPNRIGMLKKIQKNELTVTSNPYYTNRIHELDAASLLSFLYKQPTPSSCYIGTDDKPVLNHELTSWLAEQMHVHRPKIDPSIKQPPRGNKRCSNKHIKSLGFQFRYPTYKDGYRDILSQVALS